jgi:hypothetical protein
MNSWITKVIQKAVGRHGFDHDMISKKLWGDQIKKRNSLNLNLYYKLL